MVNPAAPLTVAVTLTATREEAGATTAVAPVTNEAVTVRYRTVRTRSLNPLLLGPLALLVTRRVGEGEVVSAPDLTRPECLRLLTTVSVGRFVFTAAGLPAVLPAGFVVDQDVILAHVTTAACLARQDGAVVAFQADDIDPHTYAGWSVTAVGEAHLLTPAEINARVRVPLSRTSGVESRVLAINPTVLTGYRL